jgi:hypothetical protein
MGGWPAIAGIAGGTILGLTGASVAWSSRFPTAVQGLGAFAQLGGGLLGAGLIASSFFGPHPTALHDEIEATEWHTPSSWTD